MPDRDLTIEEWCREAVRRGLEDGFVGRQLPANLKPGWDWFYERGRRWGQENRLNADRVIGERLTPAIITVEGVE